MHANPGPGSPDAHLTTITKPATPTTARCPSCDGVELYTLARELDSDWVEVRLCRRCHAGDQLVLAIDRLVSETFAE